MESNIAVQRKWLIKSSTKIVGPYTIDELIVELGAKNVSLIDEIRDPQTRWKFIREHPLLEEVVRRLRELQAQQSDDTGTQSNGTVTSETEETTTIISNENGESQGQASVSVAIPVKSPQFDQNLLQKNQSTGSTVWPWLIGFFVMACSLGFFYWKSQKAAPVPGLTAGDRIQIAYALGDYPRVTELFEQGSIETKNFNKQQAVRAYLYSENLSGGFQKAWSAVSLNPPEADIWPFDQALHAIIKGNLDEATDIYEQEAFLSKSKIPADLNKAFIHFENEQYQKAYDDADSLLRKGVTEPILLLAKATALLYLPHSGNLDDRIKRSLEDLMRYESNYVEYSNEAKLLRAFLKLKLKDVDTLESSLMQLIQKVPQLSNRHEVDVRVNTRFLRKKLLEYVSKEITNRKISKAIKEGVLLWIALQKNDRNQIKENLYQNYNLFIENPEVSPLLSYALMIQGDSGRSASVLSGSIPETSLSLYMSSMTCYRKDDLKCAERLARKAISKDAKDVSSISLLARIKSHDGQIADTQNLLRQGRLVSPTFSEWALIERDFEW